MERRSKYNKDCSKNDAVYKTGDTIIVVSFSLTAFNGTLFIDAVKMHI